MDSYRHQVDYVQSKQPDKNFFIKRLDKDGSTITTHLKHKEGEQVMCAISLCAFGEEDKWYIDSSFYHHMSRKNDKFVSLKKKKSGKIILRNCSFAKVPGMGNIDVDFKNREESNVLLVEGIKKKIPSVVQIVDEGHVIIFTSIGHNIIEDETREVIVKGLKNVDKLYVLKKN